MAKRFADQRFVVAEAVERGGVDQADADVESAAEQALASSRDGRGR